jgi:hypothetical protein
MRSRDSMGFDGPLLLKPNDLLHGIMMCENKVHVTRARWGRDVEASAYIKMRFLKGATKTAASVYVLIALLCLIVYQGKVTFGSRWTVSFGHLFATISLLLFLFVLIFSCVLFPVGIWYWWRTCRAKSVVSSGNPLFAFGLGRKFFSQANLSEKQWRQAHGLSGSCWWTFQTCCTH